MLNASRLARPPALPNLTDKHVESLQKGCFIRALTVLEYFKRAPGATPQGNLTKNDFANACNSLELGWSGYDVENVFNELVRSQQTGRFVEISAEGIDIAIHFLAKKTLKRMHEEILQDVCSNSQKPGYHSLEDTFQSKVMSQGYYQQTYEKKCTIQQLYEVLRTYNYQMEELDVKFLATQYTVSGRSSEIHYQKLIDDVKNASRNAAGLAAASGDPIAICNAIVKQTHILGYDSTRYLQEQARNAQYTQQELTALLSQRMQLCPEVCTEQQLGVFWMKVDTRHYGSVSANDVARFV